MKHINLFIALVVVPVVTHAQDHATVDLVILAGQSNMIGRAPATTYVPGAESVDERVEYYYDVQGGAFGASSSAGEFVVLAPWQRNSGGREFGPEISLGRTLAADPSRDLAIIKVAVGGTDIAQWLPGRTQYKRLQEGIRDGINALQAKGRNVQLLGFTWMQGEHDAISGTRAKSYGDNLSTLVSGFRTDMALEFPSLGFQEARVFLVEPAEWTDGSATRENSALVDQALSDYADSDPNAWFIPTSDFDEYVDAVHLNARDQLKLGTRVAYRALGLADSPIVVGGYHSIGRETHWDDMNVGLTGTASQSSNHRENTVAMHAVDQDLRSMARTSSDEIHHWWQIELDEQTALNEINIVNGGRGGRYLTDGGGLRVDVLAGADSTWHQDFVGTEMDDTLRIPLSQTERVVGDVIRLTKLDPISVGSSGALRLREVEIIADAPSFQMSPFDAWYFEIDAKQNTSDSIEIAGRLDINNSQFVVSLIDGSLKVGDTFDLLDSQETVGQFSSVDLPVLDDDLQWHTADIYTNGSISVAQRGDFNNSGTLDAADIDLLSSHQRQGTTESVYDLNGDEAIDQSDRLHWIERLTDTVLGDSNLDGVVEFSDFLAVSNSFGHTGGWAEGDFDGNGTIEFADFLLLSDNFGNVTNTSASVPEPSTAWLATLGTIGLIGFRKRT